MFFVLSFMVLWRFVVASLAAGTPTTTWTLQTNDETTKLNQYDRWHTHTHTHTVRTRVTHKQTSFRTYERNLYIEPKYNKSTISIFFNIRQTQLDLPCISVLCEEASFLLLFLWTSVLPDDGWSGQSKYVLVSNKN